MRLLRETKLRIRSTLRPSAGATHRNQHSHRPKDKAPQSHQRTHSTSTTNSQDTSARTLQSILSFRPPKSRARSELSTEATSADETADEAVIQLEVERRRWKLSSTQLERKVDVLQDEVGRLKEELAERGEEVDRVRRQRDELKRRLRKVEDEDGEGSVVGGLKRQMERVRWCAAWYKMKVMQMERERACEERVGGMEKGDGDEWDDVVGEEVMMAIEELGVGAGVEGWKEGDGQGDEDCRGWKDKEIERLEEMLKEEFGVRVELEGMVEEMAEALNRRDEEERRASEYLEGRWRRAEEDLRLALSTAHGERGGWGPDSRRVTTGVGTNTATSGGWGGESRRVTTAVGNGDNFWM